MVGVVGLNWWFSGCSLVSCLAATWRWRFYHKRHHQDADLIKTLLERDSATLPPLWELRKVRHRHNFDAKAQIGKGGFAIVFKSKLNNGATLAIKKSYHEGSKKERTNF